MPLSTETADEAEAEKNEGWANGGERDAAKADR